jgi:hypothetical protein
MSVVRGILVISVAWSLGLCSSAWSATGECLKAVFEYGSQFNVSALGPTVQRRQWKTENRDAPGEFVQWTTLYTQGIGRGQGNAPRVLRRSPLQSCSSRQAGGIYRAVCGAE